MRRRLAPSALTTATSSLAALTRRTAHSSSSPTTRSASGSSMPSSDQRGTVSSAPPVATKVTKATMATAARAFATTHLQRTIATNRITGATSTISARPHLQRTIATSRIARRLSGSNPASLHSSTRINSSRAHPWQMPQASAFDLAVYVLALACSWAVQAVVRCSFGQ